MIDYTKKNDFDHARNECARLDALIRKAIDEDRDNDRMFLEEAYDYWTRRMEILSGLAELANPDYEQDVKRYAEELAKWIMMRENGQIDPDMRRPRFPERNIPF